MSNTSMVAGKADGGPLLSLQVLTKLQASNASAAGRWP
jgi:hypothetical protein